MTGSDLVPLAPLVALFVTPIAIVLTIAIRRHHGAAFTLAIAGFAVALASVVPASRATPATAGVLLTVDGLSIASAIVLTAGALVVALMSRLYLERASSRPEEYYALVAIAAAGGVALASTEHLAGVFIAVETMSVALYGLIAYTRERPSSIEAALKYLIMTGAASAVLLFGAALIYADTGGLSFGAIERLAAGDGFAHIGLAGIALVVAGLAFKLAVVPFHMWVGDVYQGAPAPVAALVATVSKGAVAIATFRMLGATGALDHPEPAAIVTLLAVLSMVAGNLLALLQTRVKRLLAYSSIAHLGYLLVAVVAAGAVGLEALVFYLVAYFLTIYLLFGVVTALSPADTDADPAPLYHGLCWRRPLLGLAFVLGLLSLIGVPLTAGFFAKLYVIAAGAGDAQWGLVVAVVLTSAIGAFYYVRLIALAVSRPGEGEARLGGSARESRSPVEVGTLLAVLALLLVLFGVAPAILDPLLLRATDALP